MFETDSHEEWKLPRLRDLSRIQKMIVALVFVLSFFFVAGLAVVKLGGEDVQWGITQAKNNRCLSSESENIESGIAKIEQKQYREMVQYSYDTYKELSGDREKFYPSNPTFFQTRLDSDSFCEGVHDLADAIEETVKDQER